eukprot:CAMPEP_0172468900 /NCGR_PEP_ID=MMETSP1065-20121228/62383_1 /TAXON_ID=265537 /ORGANISM="Amphiprora paludosa, Strain CCMP125" /LENGTH=380 /DNA_ID=CAMNT_0013226393 /DNA_START=215 /DNA_END=1354 /DNA_ORIENTATION=-
MSRLTVNIEGRKPVDDPHYRYKMPLLCVMHEKNWTLLPNLTLVANAIHRQDSEVHKYIGTSLCTQISWRDGRPAVKGHFQETKILQTLRQYIQDFCLCETCEKPETAYRIRMCRGTAVISQKCHACGAKHVLADSDHKVRVHIVAEFEKSRAHRGKEKKPLDAMTQARCNTNGGNLKLPQKQKKEKTKAKTRNLETFSNHSTEEQSPVEIVESGMNDEQEAFVETVDAVIKGPRPTSAKEWVRVVSREVRFSMILTNKERIRVLLHAWFQTRRSEESKDKDALPIEALRRLLNESDMMRKYMESYVITVLEEVFFLTEVKHAVTFVQWLRNLWEEDLVSEETIFGWADEATSSTSCTGLLLCSTATHSRLNKASRPLIKW